MARTLIITAKGNEKKFDGEHIEVVSCENDTDGFLDLKRVLELLSRREFPSSWSKAEEQSSGISSKTRLSMISIVILDLVSSEERHHQQSQMAKGYEARKMSFH